MSRLKCENIKRLRSNCPGWGWLFAMSVVVASFAVAMEWLFFATKPSFLSGLGWWDKISVLFIAPLPLLAAVMTINLVLLGIAAASGKESVRSACQALVLAGLSLTLAGTLLLMMDNFTYTMFHFGIKSRDTLGKIAYIPVLAGLVIVSWRIVLRLTLGFVQAAGRRVYALLILAFCVLAVLDLVVQLDFHGLSSPRLPAAQSRRPLRTPNIILLSSDGVNADHMSIYGYQRDTTPFMRTFAAEHGSLFSENAFANAGNTGGSVTSLLTGKRSLTTRVYYPPDILTGQDSFQHLPGILRRAGYQTADISVRHFADAYDLNMRNGFDCANERYVLNLDLQLWTESEVIQSAAYLLGLWYERIRNRTLYIFGLATKVDNYDEVTGNVQPEQLQVPDEDRWKQLVQFMDSAAEPFFLHLHLMGTHGPKFYPSRRVFSDGQEQNKSWMMDYYDDAILDYDRRFQDLIGSLTRRQRLDNTLIVVSSDHGKWYRTNVRIPLLFFFPGEMATRSIRTNTQLLDVAPTILDYLGMEKPVWMAGESILHHDPDRFRPIVGTSMDAIREKGGLWFVDAAKIQPPYYDLTRIDVVVCDRIYELDFYQKRMRRSSVKGHTDPCPPASEREEQDIFSTIGKILEQNGYPAPPLSDWAEGGSSK